MFRLRERGHFINEIALSVKARASDYGATSSMLFLVRYRYLSAMEMMSDHVMAPCRGCQSSHFHAKVPITANSIPFLSKW